ncbi:methyl-accepting chemotaxis protein [Spirochaeta thermophila]|uniref:Methyl-accepting chemotaxis sensory transducer n=1 Tax=Winmispira thermophila (strain ATCC 49972 / DSM 6192 / RI 19.B1) TaxID=665571 RepID=E0RS02_WINT6|nr:methyl-accepting chemotaxis protein [Spirochaeta thermophila]ADN01789.1 hypothetical protein STHERM_c08400 [Spirochaeta thermophila DSM 6192]
MRESLEAIEALQEIILANLAEVQGLYDELYRWAGRLYGVGDSVYPKQFYVIPPVTGGEEEREEALVQLSFFDNALTGLDGSVETSLSVLEEQTDLIDGQIRALRQQAFSSSLVVVGIMVTAILLVLVLTARGMARRIYGMLRGIGRLKEGRLSVAFDTRGNDELASIGRSMEEFTRVLRAVVESMSDTVSASREVRESLSGASVETNAALEKVSAAVKGVEEKMVYLEETARATAAAVTSIVEAVDRLKEQIQVQASMVEQSTAAVTEVITTIGSMAAIAREHTSLGEDLVRISKEGKDVFESGFRKMEAVVEMAGRIEEMSRIIGNIASQTNLLAINAAIEAAHAGDAGKGFAVVAEEVRKLAEASSKSSREIADSIREITGAIEGARAGISDTRESFSLLGEKIEEVSAAIVQIAGNLQEAGTGSQQILSAVTTLRDTSNEIHEDSLQVAEETRRISASVSALEEVVEYVTSAMGRVEEDLREVLDASRKASDLVVILSERETSLEERLSYFKTEES